MTKQEKIQNASNFTVYDLDNAFSGEECNKEYVLSLIERMPRAKLTVNNNIGTLSVHSNLWVRFDMAA